MRMRHARRWLWGLAVALCALTAPAGAGPLRPLPDVLLTVTESTRAKLLAYLARGDIAGAIGMYEVHTGQQAPTWLRNLQVVYSVASQVPSKCQESARTIHEAFSQLGRKPEYLAFRATNGVRDYMVFELTTGKQVPVSQTGYHVAIRLDGMVYDAYTGPAGMKLNDYLTRLHALGTVTWEIVSQP